MKIDTHDNKMFMIGLVSAFVACILWDVYKKQTKIFEFAEKDLEQEVKSLQAKIPKI